MTGKLSGEYTKAIQEAEHEGETEADEVVGKVIKRRKSYNTVFPIGVIISHEEIR